ncbi:hypothetical protein DPMN_125208 [Dreissena polymorpha]|uniref:PKD/REJ-like domain-containing protein n=1 Tax=Dreissena polymorpha TaxID=45954 RepID=A0A9D4GXT8_DREPO|nr:hypothetical protein DPMN_125208 [Dreissena polymorpha]
MEFNSTPNCSPDIYWSLAKAKTTKTINAITTEYTDISFQQPNTSVLKLDKGYLEEGDFIVCLDVKFPSAGPSHWVSDCMMLRVVLPELIAYITGGEFRTISYGDVVIIDASSSRDPVNISTINEPLEAIWSVTSYVDTATLDAFQANTSTIPQTPTYHKIKNGSDYGLRLDTKLFNSSGETLLVMFTLSRGSRRSTVYQVLHLIANAAPMSLR